MISLLIVSTFVFVQIASASHLHAGDENSPEPEVCAACLAPTQDDDEVDLTPSHPAPFVIPNTLDFDLTHIADVLTARNHEDVSVPEPPNLRLSAPRAPPV